MLNKLVVVPSDPLDAYIKAGYSDWLERYYNPAKAFKEVYCLSPRENSEYESFGMKVIGVDGEKFKSIIKKIKPDVIRAYGSYWPSDFVTQNRVDNIPVIVSVHDTCGIFDSVIDADSVFCMSKIVQELVIEKGVKPEKTKILPNRVDKSIFHPVEDAQILQNIRNKFPDGKMILHVGRKHKQKNIDNLIRALQYLPEDYFAVFIGRGKTDFYIELAEEIGVNSRCYWIESIINSELPKWYSACDCMCTPSRYEGFGIVFIEAAACGSCVVTSDIAPMNEYFVHNENAYLVKEFENPEKLAEGISKVCNDVDFRNKISSNAIKIADRFEQGMIDALEVEYYKEVITNYRK